LLSDKRDFGPQSPRHFLRHHARLCGGIMPKSDNSLPLPSPTELQRIARMPEAEHLSGLSEDTLRRQFPDLILKLSKRTSGMRVGDALRLSKRAAP
jgi:hypothetical protein